MEDPVSRKLLYSMLYDQMKNLELSGVYFLKLLKAHLPQERSEDVIGENLQFNVPSIINRYLPYEMLLPAYGEFFELVVTQMLAPKHF